MSDHSVTKDAKEPLPADRDDMLVDELIDLGHVLDCSPTAERDEHEENEDEDEGEYSDDLD